MRTLSLRAATLLGVLLTVLVLLVVTLGASGFSDRILTAVINEEIRTLRTAQATQSRDPDALEAALDIRRAELIDFYDLNQAY